MWCVDVQHNGMVINRYHISASKWDVSYNRDAQQVAVAVFEQWTPVVTDSRDQKENDRKSQKKRFQKTHEFLFVLWFRLFVVTAFFVQPFAVLLIGSPYLWLLFRLSHVSKCQKAMLVR